jgi:hypothetical protein
MSEPIDWIAAADALRIVSDRLGMDGAQAALVAGAGAIATRARRFTVEVPNACGQKAVLEDELVEIPREFWSGQGGTTPDQDWDAGSFSTWVNNSFQHQAFGVEFDRAALAALAQPAG